MALFPTSSQPQSHQDSSSSSSLPGLSYFGPGPYPTMTTTASTISSTSPRSHSIPTLHKSELPFSQTSVSSSAASSTRSRHSSISAGATITGGPSGADNLIDVMEKEQEGIVLKLMKEIQSLKDENKQLKQQLARISTSSHPGGANSHSRSQSFSNPMTNFNLNSLSSTSSNSSISTPTPNGGGSLSRSSSQRRSLNSVSSRRFPSNVSASSQPINPIVVDPYGNEFNSYSTEYRSKKNRRKSTAGSISFGNYSLKPPDSRDSSISDTTIGSSHSASHTRSHYLDDVTNSPSHLALKHNERR